MKRLQTFISLLLTGSLLLAGVVGLSPVLHRLVEHGGTGGSHTHRHAHPHAFAKSASAGDEFGLPVAAFQTLLRWAGRGALAALPESAPAAPTDPAGHHHYSLAQLLSGGGVDLAPEASIPVLVQTNCLPASFVEHSLPRQSRFDPQSAGRAPPVLQG